MSNIIDVKNLSFHYGNHKIFDNISFEIEEGSFYTIIDTDNNGKSTLANILSCFIEADSGLKIFNRFVNEKNLSFIKKYISYVSENVDRFFILEKVYDNVFFVLRRYGLSDELIHKKINELIYPLGFKYLLKKKTSTLSYGEKKLIALFISLSIEPRILILDNFFSSIGVLERQKLIILLNAFNKKGMTILNFTSDSNEMLYGTNVIILKNNSILLKCDIESAFKDIKLYEDNNISIPFIINLSSKLMCYGKVDKIYFSMKELVNDLWR